MSQRPQFWLRVGLFLLGTAFLLQIILAALSVSIFVEGPMIGGLVWGKVTLVDLYLGFIISLLFLWMLEPRKLLVLLFVPLFLVMGNWLLCWYLAWRWPHLFRN
ncbi:hypothetical protein NFC81_06990 [Salinispirillum sp. LH 10-3-1]|uniref:DUF1475 domain-containing protein n=1 Tax=Salinispirillum sp. LH 10-3-1 TaxID=2952525 RepID=A0AB38YK28_9GAMM